VADADVDERRNTLRFCRTDPVFRILLGRWGLDERGVAVLTAAFGFGVLTTWYLVCLIVDPAALGRRGPFEYFSASAGDLVLLPLLTATAFRYLRQVLGGLLPAVAAALRDARRLGEPVARAYNISRGLTFVIAFTALAFALEHVDEVYGADRNWTVPEWGRLTPVAAYHQAFFALQAFIVGSLIVRHLITVRLLLRLARSGSRRAALAAVAERSLRVFGWALLGWGFFVSLRVMDFFYLVPTVSASALMEFPAAVSALVIYYVLLLVVGIVPIAAVTPRYGLRWTGAPTLLTVTAFIAPIVGPAMRILAARLLAL
jgi:hypothetical protein